MKGKRMVSLALCIAMAGTSILGTGNMRRAMAADGENREPSVQVWVMNAADRAFNSSKMPQNAQKNVMLYAAGNEYEAAQILVRSEEKAEQVSLTAGDLTCEHEKIDASEISIYREYSAPADVPGDKEKTPDGSNMYTDALLENEPLTVPAGETQPYWVRIHVPKNQTPGIYTGSITVHTSSCNVEVPVAVKVYDVNIPDTNKSSFKMLNWFASAGCDFGALESSIPGQFDCDLYDETWWRVLENIAKDLAIHRNNVEFIDFQALLMPGTTIDGEGNYSLHGGFIYGSPHAYGRKISGVCR